MMSQGELGQGVAGKARRIWVRIVLARIGAERLGRLGTAQARRYLLGHGAICRVEVQGKPGAISAFLF
jgi:hypothetical protein